METTDYSGSGLALIPFKIKTEFRTVVLKDPIRFDRNQILSVSGLTRSSEVISGVAAVEFYNKGFGPNIYNPGWLKSFYPVSQSHVCFFFFLKVVCSLVLLQSVWENSPLEQFFNQTFVSFANSSPASCLCFQGKPPTKKAKVLQKQPLTSKLSAFNQQQPQQQGGLRKSGEFRTRLRRTTFRVSVKLLRY